MSKMETDILGYNGNYTLTKSGDVFSYKYKKKRKLKPQKVSQSTKGYYQVRLFGDKGDLKGRLQYVHRLVYQTLIGDIPEGKEIDHIDGDTTNNSVENLQLLTPRENKVKGLDKNWRPYRKKFIKDYQKLGTNFMTGKYETHRFNSEFSDYYTETNFKKVRGRDEKGRYE